MKQISLRVEDIYGRPDSKRVIIDGYEASCIYHIVVDGFEVSSSNVIEVKGEGKHSVSVSGSKDVYNTEDIYNKDIYDTVRAELEFCINVPYSVPANVISLKNNTYDEKDPDINPSVEFEVWSHPFMMTQDTVVECKSGNHITGRDMDNVEEIPHGNHRYTSYTYTGKLTDNDIMTSKGNAITEDNILSQELIYKVSDWNFTKGEYTKPIAEAEMKKSHLDWYEMYNHLKDSNRDWNIENWDNDKFKDLLGYYKYKDPNNTKVYQSAYKVKEYRTVETFLEALNNGNAGGLEPPTILGIDPYDITQIALYPGVVRGMNQYYAAWVDELPFELNDKTELTTGDLYKQSNIHVITQKMKRAKDGTPKTDGQISDADRIFRIDTVKPQFPQVNIDLESVMRNPFILSNTEVPSGIEVRYRLKRILYKYYRDDDEDMYDYTKIVGDCTYEIIDDFELGNYVWEDGDYILDVWDYKRLNKTFRHRSFYFTVNTMKNMDIEPLRAKIIPLSMDKYDRSVNGEMLVDWITGDYYINVNGVIKSATVKLNKAVSETEEVEFQRLTDAADYMDMLEDDILRYIANKELIDEMMKDIYRLISLYDEYVASIARAKNGTEFDQEYIDDMYRKLIELYDELCMIEGYLEELDRATEQDKTVMANMKDKLDEDEIKLADLEFKLSLLEDRYMTNDSTTTNPSNDKWTALIDKETEIIEAYLKNKPAYTPTHTDTGNVPESRSLYSVYSNELYNATLTNKVVTVEEGSSYLTVVKPDPGYNLERVNVFMNGGDITNNAVKNSDGSSLSPTDTVSMSYDPNSGKLILTTNSDAEVIDDTLYMRFGYVEGNVLKLNGSSTIDLSGIEVEEGSLIVYIGYVSGDIEIRGVCSEIPVKLAAPTSRVELTKYLTNVKFDEVEYGSGTDPYVDELASSSVYTVVVEPIEGYIDVEVSVTMNDVDVTADTYNDGVINIPVITGDIVITADGVLEKFGRARIDNQLIGCTNDSKRRYIAEGIPYKGKLTPNVGYAILPDVRIRMENADKDDRDITADVYNYATGEIFIPKVTGDITIEAYAREPKGEVIVGSKLRNVKLDNYNVNFRVGDSYTTKFTIDEGRVIQNLQVSMGNKDITDDVVKDNTIDIPMLVDHVMIQISANDEDEITVHKYLTNTTIDNDATVVEEGEDFIANLKAIEDHELVYVKIIDADGNDITSRCYKGGTIRVPNMKSAIVITAISISDEVNGDFIIRYDLENVTVDNEVEGAALASEYTNKIHPAENCRVEKVCITMNGEDVTKDVYNKYTHEINIPCVSGDISITVICKPIATSLITFNLVRVFLSDPVDEGGVTIGGSYHTTLFAENEDHIVGYVSVVTESGEDITDQCYYRDRLFIRKITENIIVTAVAYKEVD